MIPNQSSRPVVVLVPGAWHTAEHYRSFTELLKTKGYDIVSGQFPSCGSRNPKEQDVRADAAFIRKNWLLPSIDAGRDVVLVMHSYGGCPGPVAAVGLSKTERSEQGKAGGIIGLAFISTFVVKEGQSLLDMIPGKTFGPWHKLLDDGHIESLWPKEIFYADAPDALAQKAIAGLKLQSQLSFQSKSPANSWPMAAYDGRRSYLHCIDDRAIPLVLQKFMLKESGVKWHTTEMKSSHSPFLSYPQDTADWLDGQAKMFAAVK